MCNLEYFLVDKGDNVKNANKFFSFSNFIFMLSFKFRFYRAFMFISWDYSIKNLPLSFFFAPGARSGANLFHYFI